MHPENVPACPNRTSAITRLLALAVLVAFAPGCSFRKIAINTMADALAQGGSSFSSDEDPDLVKAAAPTSLKVMESLLAEAPRHEGLLLATAKGFTEYAFAFVDAEADELESKDYAAASALHLRARRIYIRARDYGLRGLEVRNPGVAKALRADAKSAVRRLSKRDVPLMYWTAAAWASAITLGKDTPELVADQSIVEALVDRAFELDEAFEDGALHSFLITYEASRQGASGDAAARSRRHLERAIELSKSQLASPFVSFAETVSVQKQNVAEFRNLLARALAINVDARPEWRLENLVMQRRARWLLSRTEDLFLDAGPPPAKPE